jgi:hypothetical protein
MNFFPIDQLKKKNPKAAYRTFMSCNDYITQDLTMSNTKWLTSSFCNSNVLHPWDWIWEDHKYRMIDKCYTFTQSDANAICEFFKEHKDNDDYVIWQAIIRYQEKVMKSRRAEKREAELRRLMEDIYESNKECGAFDIKANGLIIVVPKCSDDLRREGEVLHHCVATYIDKVAKGETNIFFIRKENAPDTPYFTMEWKNNKLIQCRGTHNCDMPPKVKAFVKVFEEKMRKSNEVKAG